MTNILRAIKTIVDNPIPDLVSYYKGKNRTNTAGDALECFIKDIFSNTINENNECEKMEKYNECFSYSGNPNNPPDLILISGDAIKIKQIESSSSKVRLTESYPRSRLFFTDSTISNYCRNCEAWNVKDIIYIIGVTEKKRLIKLWMVYGNCYFADNEIYQETLRKSDPLGITSFSTGKCDIELPENVFEYCGNLKAETNFSVNCILTTEKYLSSPSKDRESLEILNLNQRCQLIDTSIKDPNNPQSRISTKLVKLRI